MSILLTTSEETYLRFVRRCSPQPQSLPELAGSNLARRTDLCEASQ